MKVVIGRDLAEIEEGVEARTGTSPPIVPAEEGADLAPLSVTDHGEIAARETTGEGVQNQERHLKKGKTRRENSNCRGCLKQGLLQVK